MKVARCPSCRRVAAKEGNKLWPFCSERCQLVDLGRWLGEEYRVAGEDPDGTGRDRAVVSPSDDDDR